MSSPNNYLEFNEVDTLAVNTIRILSAEMVQKANSGHPGMPMGFALAAHVLWSRFLNFNPDDPYWAGRDRFILSAGHGSALLYSLLHLSGYDLSLDDLKSFRQLDSRTPGHPEYGMTPGVETTTGPLGQGFANAVGLAVAQRYIRQQLNIDQSKDFDPFNHNVFVVSGDGDLQEGISGEAASFAGLQKLGSLVVLYDDNHISIDGTTEVSWAEDVPARFKAYGWHVCAADGNDFEGIAQAIEEAKEVKDKPSLVSIRTHIGYGSPHKQDTSASHGSPLGEEELALTKKALNFDYPSFTIPEEVYEYYTEVADKGRATQKEWEEKLDKWLKSDNQRVDLWAEFVLGKLPENWDSQLKYPEVGEDIATRNASGLALNAIAPLAKSLFGGCADLAGSVKSDVKGASEFLPQNPDGRNIRFGIREHAMGAIANGIALYGNLHAYTGTFLVFSDYMRPAVRLAALMKLPVIYLFSHDSIGVGEDGPTHQPVEHYAALRSIPNLQVFRPADLGETMESWRAGMMRKDGPVCIITTRQKVGGIDRSKYAPASETLKGGYILADCEDSQPEIILIGTGGQLFLALQAYEKLSEEGIKARVVSLPCWELFEEQDKEYQEMVLPQTVTARVAIESGITQGWEKYLGNQGKMIGMNCFGESAPANLLFEKYGFTLDNVLKTAKEFLK